MVVILILPSTTSSTNGCDEFNYSNQQHQRLRHTSYTDYHVESNATNCRSPSATPTKSKCFVRHVTRINISDVYSQVEFDGESDPVTKEGKSSCRNNSYLSFIQRILHPNPRQYFYC